MTSSDSKRGRRSGGSSRVYGVPKGDLVRRGGPKEGKGFFSRLFGGGSSSGNGTRNGGSYRPAPVKNLMARSSAPSGGGAASRAGNNKYRAVREPRNLRLDLTGLASSMGKFLLLCVTLVFLVVVSVGLLLSYRYMTSLPYFALQEIAVEGNQRLTEPEIIASSGVEPGQNSLAINIKEVEYSLLQNHWIETASVKRVLPNRLRISVTERQPCFWVEKDDKVYYADSMGQLIAPVGQEKFASLPVIEVVGDEAGPKLERLPELIRLIDAQALPFGLKQTSFIRISAKNGIEFYLEEFDVTVSTGLDDWKESFFRLSRVWTDLQRRKELAQVKTIRAMGPKVLVYKRT